MPVLLGKNMDPQAYLTKKNGSMEQKLQALMEINFNKIIIKHKKTKTQKD